MTKAGQRAQSGYRPRGKPFPPGVSGNPRGMKPGTRHRHTLLVELLSHCSNEEISATELALQGAVIEQLSRKRRRPPSEREARLVMKLLIAVSSVILQRSKQAYRCRVPLNGGDYGE